MVSRLYDRVMPDRQEHLACGALRPAIFTAQTLHMASVLAASVLAASVLAASVAARAAAAADADAVLPTLLLLLLLPPLRVAPRLGPGAWGRRGPPHSTSNLFFLVFSCTRQRPAVLETQ